TPNGQDFADRRPVLEHERRHEAARIDRAVGLRILLSVAEVDRHEGHCQSLLRQEDADAARIGRRGRMIEFQVICGHWSLRSTIVQSLEPPSTWMVSPVIHRASSDARKAMTLPMSLGCARRFSACML